jgi:hypothetical protein
MTRTNQVFPGGIAHSWPGPQRKLASLRAKARRALAPCFWCALWVYGCSSAPPLTGMTSVPESSCEQYLDVLRTEKQAGVSCATSKQHAEQADPDCKLVFNCKDAGHNFIDVSR